MDKTETVYNFIARYVEANARPPTLDEIAQSCGLSGRSHAAYWLTKLRDRGLVAWQHNHPRTIRILGAENPDAGGMATPQRRLDL